MKRIANLLIMIGKALSGTAPEPAVLMPAGYITVVEASSILLDVIESLDDDTAGLYLPDQAIKTYNKSEVIASNELREVSAITYIKEEHDCDDFAALLYGLFAGLVWTKIHSLNWFIDEDKTFWWIEPQSGKLSRTLEGYQGKDVRFFIGR